MLLFWRAFNFLLFLLTFGNVNSAEFAVIHTIVNYNTGLTIAIKDSRDNNGARLALGGTLPSDSNAYIGSTSAGLGKRTALPEWIEIRWIETGPEWDMARKEYLALSDRERDERSKRYAELPIKFARIHIRGRIPESVADELKRSPLDPDRSNLPLKSLRLYFIWTIDGVKLRWRLRQRCCETLQEGGDPLPSIVAANSSPT